MIRYIAFPGAGSTSGGGGGFGLEWFEDEDQSPGYGVSSNVAIKRSQFLSYLTVSGYEGFESDPPWTASMSMVGESITVNGVTATFSAGQIEGDEFGDPVSGRFNTTPSPDKYQWLRLGGAFTLCEITFDVPISAWGSYITDMGDFSGQVSMVLHKSGGGTVTHDIPHTINGLDGAIMFVGFVDGTDTYTQVDFICSSTAEAFGLDDIVIATAAQLA